MNKKFKNNKWGNYRWQNITGEFARCSGFTYKPYHKIINEAIEEHLNRFSDASHENDSLTIPLLGKYGRRKTISRWRRYAKRSQIIHERLNQENSFGYIDRGYVKRDDEIRFLITETDNKELIVFLIHESHIIGDLNHPKYGFKNDQNLIKLYQEFRKEYDDTDDDEVLSKIVTHVSDIVAGFPKFMMNASNLKISEMPTISEIKKNEDEISYWISGFESTTSFHYLYAKSRIDTWPIKKPFVEFQMPCPWGNSYQRCAIPVYFLPADEEPLLLEEIESAIKFKRFNRNVVFNLASFLKDFLSCHSVQILGWKDGQIEVLDDNQVDVIEHNVLVIRVITRDIDSHTGDNIQVIIRYDFDTEQLSISHPHSLRVKMSKHLLKGYHIHYLHQRYPELLEQICHVPVQDLRLHNSWLILNQLHIHEDGRIEEITGDLMPQHDEARSFEFNDDSGKTSIIRDSITDESFRIHFAKNSFDYDDDNLTTVVQVDFKKRHCPFIELKNTELIKKHLLPVIAQAVLEHESFLCHGRSPFKFKYDGIIYKFKIEGVESTRNDIEIECESEYYGEDPYQDDIGQYGSYSSYGVYEDYSPKVKVMHGINIKEITPIILADGLDRKLRILLSDASRLYDGSESSLQVVLKRFFLIKPYLMDPKLKAALHQILNATREGKEAFVNDITLKNRILNTFTRDMDNYYSDSLSFEDREVADDDYIPNVFKQNSYSLEENNIDFIQYKQLSIDLINQLAIMNPFYHYIYNDDGKYKKAGIFFGKGGQILYLPLLYLNKDTGISRKFKPTINSLIRTTNNINFFVMICDTNENEVDNLSEKIGFSGKQPSATPNADNLIDFSKTHVLTEDLYIKLLTLGCQMRLTTKRYWHEEGKPDIWTLFYGKGNMTLTITDNSRIGDMIYSDNGTNYNTKPHDTNISI